MHIHKDQSERCSSEAGEIHVYTLLFREVEIIPSSKCRTKASDADRNISFNVLLHGRKMHVISFVEGTKKKNLWEQSDSCDHQVSTFNDPSSLDYASSNIIRKKNQQKVVSHVVQYHIQYHNY